jgi:hypothetical protein
MIHSDLRQIGCGKLGHNVAKVPYFPRFTGILEHAILDRVVGEASGALIFRDQFFTCPDWRRSCSRCEAWVFGFGVSGELA